MVESTETQHSVVGTTLTMIRAGAGRPLLIFHDELGYPGWTAWNESLAHERTLLIPLQPGYGKTPRQDWIRSYRDLAGFYAQALREMRLDPIDVIGFSAGGYIAAEMAAGDPKLFSRMILVAPMGIKPAAGEIMDFFAMTIRRHLRATVADPAGTPEFTKIYGGEMTPEQFELFEDARSESARIGWEPYMHNPSLPNLLRGVKIPTMLIRGTRDEVVPAGCIDGYRAALAGAQVALVEGAGHRPEIENSVEFERIVTRFLAA
ncbi:MAG: alpha/beta fold hydrolase [Candidatus Binataceae bacterium]